MRGISRFPGLLTIANSLNGVRSSTTAEMEVYDLVLRSWIANVRARARVSVSRTLFSLTQKRGVGAVRPLFKSTEDRSGALSTRFSDFATAARCYFLHGVESVGLKYFCRFTHRSRGLSGVARPANRISLVASWHARILKAAALRAMNDIQGRASRRHSHHRILALLHG